MAENFTPRQEMAISKLRGQISDISDETYKETSVLLKFLIARDFNEEQAESMIRKNIRWKKEMQIDDLLSDFKPPEVLEKYFSVAIIGFDKEDCVVGYIPIGKVDGKGLSKSVNSIYGIKTFIAKILEGFNMQESQAKRLGKSLTKCTYIYDAAQLSLAKIAHVQSIQFFLKFIVIFQDNFPETIKKLYVINAPVFFASIWTVVKKLLGSSLLKKVDIYGQNGWKDELLKLMDADQLPAFLGGRKTDPDGNPLCLTLVNHLFEPIPKKYFLEKDIEKMARKPGVKSARIDRQRCITEALKITEANSSIHWEFELKNCDIGFGISLEITDGTSEELIPVHKIETELGPYNGMYRCKKLGKHLVIFDNSYSWILSKEIHYRIWVTNSGAT